MHRTLALFLEAVRIEPVNRFAVTALADALVTEVSTLTEAAVKDGDNRVLQVGHQACTTFLIKFLTIYLIVDASLLQAGSN